MLVKGMVYSETGRQYLLSDGEAELLVQEKPSEKSKEALQKIQFKFLKGKAGICWPLDTTTDVVFFNSSVNSSDGLSNLGHVSLWKLKIFSIFEICKAGETTSVLYLIDENNEARLMYDTDIYKNKEYATARFNGGGRAVKYIADVIRNYKNWEQFDDSGLLTFEEQIEEERKSGDVFVVEQKKRIETMRTFLDKLDEINKEAGPGSRKKAAELILEMKMNAMHMRV